MRYIISYDVRNGTNDDYYRIDALLEGMGAQRVLLSQWVLRDRHNRTATFLANQIWQLAGFGAADRLFVNCLDAADWHAINPIIDPDALV